MKVSFNQLLGFLIDKDLLWSIAVWEQGGESVSSYENFVMLFQRVFDHAAKGREVSARLLSIKQGNRRMVEYALEFSTLAADSGWNKAALKAPYCQGLNADVIFELACRDYAMSLDSLIDLSIQLDNLLQDRCLHLPPQHNLPPSSWHQPYPYSMHNCTPLRGNVAAREMSGRWPSALFLGTTIIRSCPMG